MSDDEIADEAQRRFDRVKESTSAEIGLIELRNIMPEMITRLRKHADTMRDIVEIPEYDLSNPAHVQMMLEQAGKVRQPD
ncbi:hypothetical protein JI59_16175 [Novosphingobium pentaromativorans US6-1]|uniref:Uncharacterized protein n=2 Tax=Novosphingobium pentaromativorans TaxID=205844 RepID=G6E8W2_9SPHN|nr:hypothetical protein JI59_16175 [Novosphingobium pentaromativorans US6-1]EHJ62186.1 hypothetical protein NSU_0783 [Novosphingobium pentaromativorans US6-1]